MGKKILVVDDEVDILDMLRYNLEKQEYTVLTATNGLGALEQLKHEPDLVLLDVMMPGMDGWEVCRRLKQNPRTATIPVLFLTAKGSEVDEVVGLELGAEDYIVKPITLRKLLARVRVALRPRKAPADEVGGTGLLQAGAIGINVPNYAVSVDGKELSLPKKEFETLLCLVRHRGRVVSRETLLSVVWGENVFVIDRTVDVHISKIREKLGAHGSLIETVKGVGYRFRT